MSVAFTPHSGPPPAGALPSAGRSERAIGECLPAAEGEFYQGYPWCLNPFLTVREAAERLGTEVGRLGKAREAWQAGEVMTNVYLLSCAILNAVEEYLRGPTLRLPRVLAGARLSRAAGWAVEKLGTLLRWRRRARVRRWGEGWRVRLEAFLALLVAPEAPAPAALAAAGDGLDLLLRSPLPADLQAELIYFPSAFRRLDLTPHDLLALGRRLTGRFPDRLQPVLLVGLRTAGSYFAPLLQAFFRAEGYRADFLTVHTEKGPGPRERAALKRYAREGYLAVVLDDPPHTGDTIVRAVDLAVKAGFPPGRVAALVPLHPARQDSSLSLCGAALVPLEPEAWHKQQLLDPRLVERRLAEYYRDRGYAGACVVEGRAADQFNEQLRPSASDDPRRARLKRVYEVRLQTPEGEVETRHVLAKSVGWGWLGYHAFLAGRGLAGFVPPVLGLRDGILYTEWLPHPVPAPAGEDRERWVRTSASYVAARARALGLGKNPLPGLGLHRHHDGFRLMEKVLSRAYGRFLTSGFMQGRLRRCLAAQPCPFPTLIDGKMRRAEWIATPGGLLKTDYEHHGLGKNELNSVDPASDLAETILCLGLAPEEEEDLVGRYAAESGDAGVRERLFLNKLLAGTWAMESALAALFQGPPLAERQREHHRHYVDALHFLTVHTARHCGPWCRPPSAPSWHSPLAVLDIDGVLDRILFGFPCTSEAGIRALALLHGHGFALAVNTARSVPEVQEYCRAYGLAGGVAEGGSYLWDAAGRGGRALLGPESLDQLARARKALEQLPGVFLDDRYQFSVRAWTYEDQRAALGRLPVPGPLRSMLSLGAGGKVPVPLPLLAVRQTLAALGLDRLSVRQTTVDTTIVAREADKGSGLTALLEWVGLAGAETAAVGDSEPDLAMFRVAKRSFAPSHIGCARLARLLGCRVVRRPFQRGLLDAACSLAHPDGKRCPRCLPARAPWSAGEDLFLDLLQAADRGRLGGLLRALLHPGAYRVFLR